MSESLPRLEVRRRSGSEPFTCGGAPTDFNLLGFWQWASSDLASNVLRGVLAEYLVAQALGVASGLRDPWQAYDLVSPGGLTIEVKSAAYLQSWWQRSHSAINFTVRETRAWSAETNALASTAQRQAALYVFALLGHLDKPTLNPLDLDQWEFYLVPSRTLTEQVGAAKQLSLKRLLALGPDKAGFSELGAAIRRFERELLPAPT
ncbi:MAG TPA: hypothetical protein VF092_28475 [Longimicrobium sp.]